MDYLQRAAGYWVTGLVSEHILFFLYGKGRNGKSTFVETLMKLIGPHACAIATETLMACDYERHPTDIAELHGIRLAVGSEVEEGQFWAEAKIKKMTGGDRLKGRFMRQDFFEFDPLLKLVIFGNHKPSLRNVDVAIKARLHLVPFTVFIPEAERDQHLKEKLALEGPAILRWAIDGCLQWQKDRALSAGLGQSRDRGIHGRRGPPRPMGSPSASSARPASGPCRRPCSTTGGTGATTGTRATGSSQKFGKGLEERGFIRVKDPRGKVFENVTLKEFLSVVGGTAKT